MHPFVPTGVSLPARTLSMMGERDSELSSTGTPAKTSPQRRTCSAPEGWKVSLILRKVDDDGTSARVNEQVER